MFGLDKGSDNEDDDEYSHRKGRKTDNNRYYPKPERSRFTLSGFKAPLPTHPIILCGPFVSEFVIGNTSGKDHRIEGKLLAP